MKRRKMSSSLSDRRDATSESKQVPPSEGSVSDASVSTRFVVVENEELCESQQPTENSWKNEGVATLHVSSDLVRLLETLEEVTKAYNDRVKDGSLLELRIAGGWVRDSLLGRRSVDVDVACNRPGVQVASIIQEYSTKLDNSLKVGSKVGIIHANVEQSKHLETATLRIGTFDVDLVPLRTAEVYTNDSRIPTVEAGTPQQDAMRRDFTMNALFYNVTTHQVEDWTGQGLSDLLISQPRVLRTPLDPFVTFLDDPLRALRGIRFGVRFQCELDSSMVEAIQSDNRMVGDDDGGSKSGAEQLITIPQALSHKVSRERIGKELEGMMSGPHCRPVQAMELIFDLGLGDAVFGSYPAWNAAGANLDKLAHVLERYQSMVQQYPVKTAFSLRLLTLATVLAPLRHDVICKRDPDKTDETTKKNNPKPIKEIMVVDDIVRNEIKWSNSSVTSIVTILRNVDDFERLASQLALRREEKEPDQEKERDFRADVGMLLRQVREHWITCWLATTVMFLSNDPSENGGDLFQLYNWIVQQQPALDECWKQKPFFNGKDLLRELGVTRGGPIVGEVIQEETRWMLAHPEGTSDDCLAYLRSVYERLREKESSERQE